METADKAPENTAQVLSQSDDCDSEVMSKHYFSSSTIATYAKVI